MSEGGDVDPADAFGLVANVNRFDVLEALWEADEPLGFSDLHDRTGVRDSGQFNYHLGKLVPRFVREAEAGYELTHAGKRVVGAAYSGVYTESEAASVDALRVGYCPHCDGHLEAAYGEASMYIGCAECEVTVTNLEAPPIVATGHDSETLPEVFGRWLRNDIATMNRGFCRYCSGRVDVSLGRSFEDPRAESGEDGELEYLEDFLGIEYVCRECGATSGAVLGTAVLDHPAVVGFHRDHGIDLLSVPMWKLDWLFEPHGEVVEEDPLRTRVTVELGGESLVLELDESFDVVDQHRD